jgi:hypothetical protein
MRVILANAQLSCPEANTPLWRYQGISKLLHLLQTRSLFFPAVQLLNDPFEGSQTKRSVLFREIALLTEYNDAPAQVAEVRARMQGQVRRLRHATFVSCWHANDIES